MELGVIGSLAEGSFDTYAGGGRTPHFEDLRVMAQAAETLGLDSFCVFDHMLYRYPDSELGCWEAFTFLGALAASTSTIRLGPLVAKCACQVA